MAALLSVLAALQTFRWCLRSYLEGFALQVFHAGTSVNDSGEIIAVGGRVLGVAATGRDVAEAQHRAYKVYADAGACVRK